MVNSNDIALTNKATNIHDIKEKNRIVININQIYNIWIAYCIIVRSNISQNFCISILCRWRSTFMTKHLHFFQFTTTFCAKIFDGAIFKGFPQEEQNVHQTLHLHHNEHNTSNYQLLVNLFPTPT